MSKLNQLPPSYHIALSANLLKNALKKRFTDNDVKITPEQLGILKLLQGQSEGVSMNFISKNTFRDNSAVTRIIDNIEKKGYLKKEASLKDKRSILICISVSGSQVFKKASKLAKQHVEKAMNGISKEDIDDLVKTLTLIQNNIREY